MTSNMQKIIEKHREKLNFEKGTIGALHLQWLAEEIRRETLKEILREFDENRLDGKGYDFYFAIACKLDDSNLKKEKYEKNNII